MKSTKHIRRNIIAPQALFTLIIVFIVSVALANLPKQSKITLAPTPVPVLTTETPTLVPTAKATLAPTKPPAPPPAIIVWSASRALTWNDFRGTPRQEDVEKAKIAIRINAQSEYGENCQGTGPVTCTVRVTNINVTATMSTKDSYVLPGAQAPDKLEHEQLHFDLTEVYARKLRNELNQYLNASETGQGNTTNEAFEQAASKLDALLNPIVNRYQEEHDRAELQYDTESEHSLNAAGQAAWKEKIRGMLQ